MKRKIDKYKTLLEFLKIIAPGENYINLQMAQCDFVSDIIHKAVEGKNFYSNISPEALSFVKKYSKKVYKNLQIFYKKLKESEFYNCEENEYYQIVRAEIESFISLFSGEKDDVDVCNYYKAVSNIYGFMDNEIAHVRT